jgi:hypothetical protein
MFWGQTRPRTPCHQFGAHPASDSATFCLKKPEQPVLGDGTFCLKNRRNPALYQRQKGRNPAFSQRQKRQHPAYRVSTSCRTFGRQKGFPVQTSCPGQNNVLPQKAGTACLWGDDILFETGCHKVCERCSPLLGFKSASHSFEQLSILKRVTTCLTKEETACPPPHPTPCLLLTCPSPAPLGQVVWNHVLLVQDTNEMN